MKKLLSVFLSVFLLAVPLSVCAQGKAATVKEKDFSVQLEGEWVWADRNFADDNPMVSISGTSSEEYAKYLQDYNIYLEAMDETNNVYFSLQCEDIDPNDWGESFAELDEDALTEYANLLLNSMSDEEYSVLADTFYLPCENNNFLVFDHYYEDTHMVYRTAISVYNSQSYTITLAGYYTRAEMMDEWDDIIKSVSLSKVKSKIGYLPFVVVGLIIALVDGLFYYEKYKSNKTRIADAAAPQNPIDQKENAAVTEQSGEDSDNSADSSAPIVKDNAENISADSSLPAVKESAAEDDKSTASTDGLPTVFDVNPTTKKEDLSVRDEAVTRVSDTILLPHEDSDVLSDDSLKKLSDTDGTSL